MTAFEGIYTALVTPMRTDGSIDYDSLRQLVEDQIAARVSGLVPCGSTGEAVTLSDTEIELVIATVIEVARGRVKVIAGAGSNNTAKAIRGHQLAKKLGAHASLQVTPYYNRPNQEGLYQHFKAIAQSEPDFPVILYNVPSRTNVNLLPATVARLATIDNIVAIKEACGQISQIKQLHELVPDDFTILSGDDLTNADCWKAGGRGAISVTSNVHPQALVAQWQSYLAGLFGEVEEKQNALQALHQAMFIDTNPVPVKTALHMLGRIPFGLRLPLVPLESEQRDRLAMTLSVYDLSRSKNVRAAS
jgi:4-hydroxy-tetrahydrodipicolinate synthase